MNRISESFNISNLMSSRSQVLKYSKNIQYSREKTPVLECILIMLPAAGFQSPV